MLQRLNSFIARHASPLYDALTNRSHSRDFAYARSDYLRNRVLLVSIVFLVLMPFWTILDWLILAPESLRYALWGRLVMVLVLFLVLLLTKRSKLHPQRVRLAAGLMLSAPAGFYALILATQAEQTGSLIGYSFIPYMLVGMLALFPFTLIESGVLGGGLILLEVYALYCTGSLFTAAGLQDIWLLAALLSIAFGANYFQLGLMLRLYREATHDPLTGLSNRGALMRSLMQMSVLQSANPTTLLMMDLDYFKRINDEHGHIFGDEVLRHFTQIVRKNLRPSDMAARYGGEEFIAILTNTDKEAAIAVAERIRQQTELAELTDNRGVTARYTVSIGVATLKPDEPFEAAARRADNRLYEAKKQSRNCVVGV